MLKRFRFPGLLVLGLLACLFLGFVLGRSNSPATAGEGEQLPPSVQEQLYGIEPGGTAVVQASESGAICAVSGIGSGAGSACTAPDAEEPMLMVTSSDGDHLVTVVSPGTEIGTVELTFEGSNQTVTRSSSDGLTASASSSNLPSSVIVFAPSGQQIAVFHPAEDNDRADSSG